MADEFFFSFDQKLDMVLKNSHTKNDAWCRSVTGQGFFYPFRLYYFWISVCVCVCNPSEFRELVNPFTDIRSWEPPLTPSLVILHTMDSPNVMLSLIFLICRSNRFGSGIQSIELTFIMLL